jgi:cob(I)alamin adenosyltransferase
LPQQLDQGLVSIFTGDGKGKTTAAIGSIVRAAGHGLRAFIIYFMKGNDFIYGENIILSQLPNVKIANFCQTGWVSKENTKAKHKEQAALALATARDIINSGDYDIIVLDEINVAIDYKLIELEDIIQLVKEKPRQLELILTGRYANPRLMQMADLVTEMQMIKHPYNQGIKARRGIDY